jgi:glycerol-3-phosphate acyltransferase PlsY
VTCYLLGCLNGAFYIHRSRTGRDIRAEGSGNPGARNAGRVHGRSTFALVFLFDASKGYLAAGGALLLGLGGTGALASMIAVVAGHVFPWQLGLRGGKGLATALGALAAIEPLVALIGLACAALLLLATRRAATAGVIAVALTPLVAAFFMQDSALALALLCLALLTTAAHIPELQQLAIRRHWPSTHSTPDS